MEKSFSEIWQKTFRNSCAAFSQIWWKICSINLLAALIILGSTAILAAVTFLFLGGKSGVENFLINAQITGILSTSHKIFFIILIILFVKIIFTFVVLAKIGNFLLVKNFQQKKKLNLFKIFFTDSWKFFWRYVGITLRIFWYIFWPIFLLGIFGGGAMYFFAIKTFLKYLNYEIPILFFVFLILFFVFFLIILIWRVTNSFFAVPNLIHFDKKISAAFHDGIAILRGNWWKIFSLIFCFFLIIIGANLLIEPQLFFPFSKNLLLILEIFGGIISFFILTPFAVIFPYFLMLEILNKK